MEQEQITLDKNFPKTLMQAIKFFADPDVALRFMIAIRWPEGITCPRCDSDKHSFVKTRRIWICLSCKKHFSVKLGTIMEDSPIGLDKWLCGMWMICGAKNGISSYEIHRALGITQKSAWFLLHRIRLAMQNGTFRKLAGHVEIDETWIGGKARNMHRSVLDRKGGGNMGTFTAGKVAVMGLLERHGEVRLEVISDTQRPTLDPHIKRHVERGTNVYTDSLASYQHLNDANAYMHQIVNHAIEYVRGNVHTNGIENFWSLLKRTIRGTYVAVEPFHLFRYLDEQSFRFNNRKGNDAQRFVKAAQNISDKRLTYKKLTGKEPAGYETSH
jgi:transposase-like protein